MAHRGAGDAPRGASLCFDRDPARPGGRLNARVRRPVEVDDALASSGANSIRPDRPDCRCDRQACDRLREDAIAAGADRPLGPAAFAVLLGHRWNAMGRTQCYEFVPSGGRYVATALL
ncbi:SAVED domain-containing protein [Bradyrhizobium barranii]|uniref:SAVED domain-containing protein n=1 Tax=Bradyrhizobium barranii subsp. barranii TaxID=2823807 RepID=A0A7Z0Q827_9BRAD